MAILKSSTIFIDDSFRKTYLNTLKDVILPLLDFNELITEEITGSKIPRTEQYLAYQGVHKYDIELETGELVDYE
jgi:hypothetical protein